MYIVICFIDLKKPITMHSRKKSCFSNIAKIDTQKKIDKRANIRVNKKKVLSTFDFLSNPRKAKAFDEVVWHKKGDVQ